jgi:hypothetical protein
MADPHVISALRVKRAEVAGLIDALERELAQQRADLVHLDSVLRLFQPERDPTEIRPKRSVHRNRYFATGELAHDGGYRLFGDHDQGLRRWRPDATDGDRRVGKGHARADGPARHRREDRAATGRAVEAGGVRASLAWSS